MFDHPKTDVSMVSAGPSNGSRRRAPENRPMTTSALRDFLEIPYDQLEELNLEAKEQRSKRVAAHKVAEERMKYLADEKRIKAVTVCFTDLEGRLHMLDYDKKFLLGSHDNLTFDGSSIRGFSQQSESDLRLGIDWPAFYWLPADIFGPGKVLVFGEVLERDGAPYAADLRGKLKAYTEKMFKKDGTVCNVAHEIEGFLLAASTSSRPAATTTRCPATPCAPSSTAAPRRSGRWASRTRKTTPRWRPASSR
jgi:glutamine synthetase